MMKLSIFLIPILFWITRQEEELKILYKCLDDKKTSNKTICYIYENDIDNFETNFYGRPCPNGQYCEEGANLGTCLNVAYLKYTGDSCSVTNDCFSTNCTNGKCAVSDIGGPCRNHSSCVNTAFCKNSICTSILKGGMNCSFGDLCEYGYECDFLYDNKCKKYLSLPTGSPSLSDYLCQSFKMKNGKCVDLVYDENQDTIYYPCKDDSDCKGHYDYGNNEKEEFQGSCLMSGLALDKKFCHDYATKGKEMTELILGMEDDIKNYDPKGKYHPSFSVLDMNLYFPKFRMAWHSIVDYSFSEYPDCWKQLRDQQDARLTYHMSSSWINYSSIIFILFLSLIL